LEQALSQASEEGRRHKTAGMPKPLVGMVVAIIVVLLAGWAWSRFAPLHSDPPSLPQFLLFSAGSFFTYWLMWSTACGVTDITKDQLVRRLAVVAAVGTWGHVVNGATRPDITVDATFAVATAVVFGVSLFISYWFVGLTMDRVRT
jgi:hypothetical protein